MQRRKFSGRTRALIRAAIIAMFLHTFPARADVPTLINYQGVLRDAAGNPLSGTFNMTFTIYDSAAGGTPLWSETQSVSVSQGVFSVLLGNGARVFPPPIPGEGIPPSVFALPDRFLGVQVGSDPEMTPRQRIVSVPYAFRAREADILKESIHQNCSFDPPNILSDTEIQAGSCTVPGITVSSIISVTRKGGDVGLVFTRATPIDNAVLIFLWNRTPASIDAPQESYSIVAVNP